MVITRWSSLGFLDRRRRIFFLLLHTQDGGSYIMPEKHDRPAESHAVVFRQKKKNFFSSSTYTGWGEKKYYTSLHYKIFAHPDTSPSINRRRRNILLLSTRKSLPTQTRAPPSKEEEERRRILFLLLHILRLGRHHTLEFKDTRRRRILFLFLYLLREK